MCGATLTMVGATPPWFPADMCELAFVSKGTSVEIAPSADLGSAGSASVVLCQYVRVVPAGHRWSWFMPIDL